MARVGVEKDVENYKGSQKMIRIVYTIGIREITPDKRRRIYYITDIQTECAKLFYKNAWVITN